MSVITKRVPASPRSRHFAYYHPEVRPNAALSVSNQVPPSSSEELDGTGEVEQIDDVSGAHIAVSVSNAPEDGHIVVHRGRLTLAPSGSGRVVTGLSIDASDPLSILYTLEDVSSGYVLPPATGTTLGGVRIPASSGLSVAADGSLSLALPVASASVPGVIKVGAGLSIDANGILSVTATGGYTLPVASGTTLGGVKVGAGLSISSAGVLSAPASGGGTNYFSLSGNDLSPVSDSYRLTTYGNPYYTTTSVRHVGNHVDGMNNGAVGNLYLNADVYSASPAVYVRINSSGGGVYTGSWSQVSDTRKKSILEPLVDVLTSLLAFDTFYYHPVRNGTADTEVRKIGLSANQIREMFPELVSEDEEGFYSLDYSNVTVLLVRAVQELNRKMEEMKEG